MISPVTRHLPTQDNTNIYQNQTYIHASSANRTHEPSVWAGENSSFLRQGGHYDRLELVHALKALFFKIYFNIIPPSTLTFKASSLRVIIDVITSCKTCKDVGVANISLLPDDNSVS